MIKVGNAMYIKSENVLVNNALKPATLHVQHDKIKEILPYETSKEATDYGQDFILPGFIDLHIHGCYGIDVLDDDLDNFHQLRRKLLEEGTTSFFATTTTLEKENLVKGLRFLGRKIDSQEGIFGAQCLGIHLEGPFLNEEYTGSQNKSYLLKPDISTFKEFQSAANNHIKRVTLAPEKDEDQGLIRHLKDQHQILISAGHSGAAAKDMSSSVIAGVTLITHMFNGMVPLNHHDIGIVGVAMMSDELVCEIIGDGVHLCYDAIDLIKKIKGFERLILVTDSNQAKGMPAGDYNFHGRNVKLNSDGEARIKESGSLAGSVAKMNDMVRNITQNTSISLVEAFQMASLLPARLLHIDHKKGRLSNGYDADIVILNQEFHVVDVYIAGKREEEGE
jgi:N-acetylglucosamine-6-phosphate deacetylase